MCCNRSAPKQATTEQKAHLGAAQWTVVSAAAHQAESQKTQQCAAQRRQQVTRDGKVFVENRFAALEGDEVDILVDDETSSQSSSDTEAEMQETEAPEPTLEMAAAGDAIAAEAKAAAQNGVLEEAAAAAREQAGAVQAAGDKAGSEGADTAAAEIVAKADTAAAEKDKAAAVIPVEAKADAAEKAVHDSTVEPVMQASEVANPVSKAARRRAHKKTKKGVATEAARSVEACEVEASASQSVPQSSNTVDSTAECLLENGSSHDSKAPQLTKSQAQSLAELAVRLNEQNIAVHLRAQSSRRILLATPVDPFTMNGDDLLTVEPGDVVHCELTDASGWGFGTMVAPLRLAGHRGCFKCDFMRPIIAELRSGRTGDSLEFTPGSWAEVASTPNPSTKSRLREKAALNRIRAARAAWEKQKL